MLGVYIHIPFCKKICNYCDFCKVLYDLSYVDNYLNALGKEIGKRYKDEVIDSVYIGGGTPSALSIYELDKLLSILSVFKLSNDYEYTIECNIDNIDIDKINLFKSYGINRISFGVESFNKNIGNILGRDCHEELIFDNIYLTKKYFNNISIDLIYAVNSDIEVVKNDIEKFLQLDIPHVSCYALILEEHTRMYIDNYQSINEDIEYEMYKYISNTLKKHGYNHYEVSNYAKLGYESIHNKNYWLNGSYYGFGLGAVSYLDNYRITNTKNMSKYLLGNYIRNKLHENLSMQKENDLILGFRMTRGISITKFDQKYDDDLLNRDIIKELINDEYLINDNDYLRCNEKYFYVQNKILERLIGSIL